MPKEIRGKARSGDEIILDASDEACARFGVKPGEEIGHLDYGDNVFVVGTGPPNYGGFIPSDTEALWVSEKRGEIVELSFFPSEKAFRKIQPK